MRANRKLRRVAALSVLGVGMAACDASLTVFAVPPAVQAGQDFAVVIGGVGGGSTTFTGSNIGAVVQLPPGFTVVARAAGVTVDDPALLALYTPEPGHSLTSVSGFSNAASQATQLLLRASSTVGSYTLKVALATDLGTPSAHVSSPVGVTSFAQITAAPHAQVIAVQSGTVGSFATEPLPIAALSNRVLFADIDGDGRDDLVDAHGPRVFLARPGNSWLDVSPPASGAGPDVVAAGDFDGDGHLDLVHGSRTVWFGDGHGNWTQSSLQPPTNGTVVTMAVGDYNLDGLADIVECDSNGWIRVFRSAANRTFASRSFGLPGSGNAQASLALVDVNGDGLPDVVACNNIYLGDGLGTWTAVNNLTYGGSRIAVGDLDGDGAPEIVALNRYGSGDITVFAHGSGTAWVPLLNTGLPQTSSATAQQAVVLCDFDGDGRLDVVAGAGGIQLYRNAGNATFTQVIGSGLPDVLAASSQSTSAVAWLAVGDREGDGLPELLVTPGFLGDWQPLLFANLTTGAIPYGTGCAASGHSAPQLPGVGVPTVGNATFALDLRQGPVNGVGMIWVGTSRHTASGQTLPLSLMALGAPGCAVVAEPLAQQLVMLDPNGVANRPLPVPNVPALQLAAFFAQGAILTPGANALGLLTSNGLTLRIR